MLSFFTTFQPDLNALILSTVTMHSQTFSWEIDNVSIIGRDFFFSLIHIHARRCIKNNNNSLHFQHTRHERKGNENTLKIQRIKSCLILKRLSYFPVNMRNAKRTKQQ